MYSLARTDSGDSVDCAIEREEKKLVPLNSVELATRQFDEANTESFEKSTQPLATGHSGGRPATAESTVNVSQRGDVELECV